MADEDSKWAAFRTLIGSNKVLRPGEDGYDAARRVWNADSNRFPYAITFPSTKQEVAEVLAFAKSISRDVSVRCGGHSRSSVINDAIVIDLSRNMKGVTVDPVQKIARVQGGSTLALLDEATAPYKLVTPAGQVSHTGVAGLTLQGGFGYISRKLGLACDNVLSFELVTADGQFLTASKDSHPDLYWALKGAGHNFGVVTEFTFKLYDFPEFTSGNIIYPFETGFAKEYLKFLHQTVPSLPDELTIYCGFLQIPNMGRVVNIDISYFGGVADCEKALGPLLNYGTPIVKAIHPAVYLEKQKRMDEPTHYGGHYYVKDKFFSWTDEVVHDLVDHFNTATLPHCIMQFVPLLGAPSTTFKDNTAFFHRQRPYLVATVVIFEESEREEALKWGRAALSAERFNGLYTVSEDIDNKVASEQTYGDVLPRLREIKKKYDPENVFKFCSNPVA